MNIKSAEYQISNSDYRKCPDTQLPEYAFIGRSNVGKSLLINHFLINGEWYIVDLPGYGFAKRSKESREQFRRMIQGYVLGREQMTNLFVLVDSRIKPQKIDLEFMEWLGEHGVPFSIVFTKMDKLGKVAGPAAVEEYKKVLLKTWEELPPIFMTSSEDARGRDELLGYIDSINQQLKQESIQ